MKYHHYQWSTTIEGKITQKPQSLHISDIGANQDTCIFNMKKYFAINEEKEHSTCLKDNSNIFLSPYLGYYWALVVYDC